MHVVKTARSYFGRRHETRKKLKDINFNGDVYFIVGESGEDEAADINEKE